MFSELSPNNEKVEKIGVFLPLVHLDHQQRIYLKQDQPFSEIEVYLRGKEPESEKLKWQVEKDDELFSEEKAEELVPEGIPEVESQGDTIQETDSNLETEEEKTSD